jgi:hypothetical protein
MQISNALLLFALAISVSVASTAQDTTTPNKLSVPKEVFLFGGVDEYATIISTKSLKITRKISKANDRMLRSYANQEVRLRNMLLKVDSFKTGEFLGVIAARQRQASSVIRNPAKTNSKYLSLIDSALGILNFSKKYANLTEGNARLSKISEAIGNTEILQEQFNKSDMLLSHLKESSSLITDKLKELKLPVDIKRMTNSISKYNQHINEYVNLLNNRKKIEQKILHAAANTKLFKDFMSRNSILSSLFRMPDGEADQDTKVPEGLQTRESVSAGINEKLGRLVKHTSTSAQNEFEGGRSKLAEERSKYLFDMTLSGNSAGISSESTSSSKVPLKKRFTFDLNFQTHRESVITTDLGLAVGYKLNQRSTLGIGAAYKLGLGKSIEHLSLSHQGVSVRSYIDWKVKNGISITGGYEMNLIDAIRKIDQLKDRSAWQQSGLVGLTKTIVNGPGILKSTKLQILWDFLSYQQIPRAQPLVFRIGYGF